MAQRVGYYENNVEFTEGPFVIVRRTDRWRIECELRTDAECNCVIPEASILDLFYNERGVRMTWFNELMAEEHCDWLNSQVFQERIILHEKGYWYAPEFTDRTESS